MPEQKERTIFHIDVNSAFLSWSAVEALRLDPDAVDLRTIPSAVTGDRSKRHGVILAKSIPAKAYDIHTGEPTAAALRKCPDLVLVAPDFKVYNRSSKAFIAILKRYAPVVEQVSIDEAFCDFTGTEKLYGDFTELASKIRGEIRESLGFTVNIGISSNKLLAKMASDFRKPDRTHTLYPDEVPAKMWPLPIGELYGVGRSAAARLLEMNIKTIGDAAHTDPALLRKAFGIKAGDAILRSANGLSDSPVREERDAEQSYGNSTTLSEDLTAASRERILRPTLLALADSIGYRMRKDNKKGRTIAVQMRTADFKNHSKQTKLDEATDSTDVIFQTAYRLFDELWNGRVPVRLIGVTVSSLGETEAYQMSLFEDPKAEELREKRRRLDQMADQIRTSYGRGALVRGSLLKDPDKRRIGEKQDE